MRSPPRTEKRRDSFGPDVDDDDITKNAIISYQIVQELDSEGFKQELVDLLVKRIQQRFAKHNRDLNMTKLRQLAEHTVENDLTPHYDRSDDYMVVYMGLVEKELDLKPRPK
jgi:hypothetical protein